MKDLEINLKKGAESWVKQKPKGSEKMVRLTVDVTESLHQRLKLRCVTERRTIADMIRELLEEKLNEPVP